MNKSGKFMRRQKNFKESEHFIPLGHSIPNNISFLLSSYLGTSELTDGDGEQNLMEDTMERFVSAEEMAMRAGGFS